LRHLAKTLAAASLIVGLLHPPAVASPAQFIVADNDYLGPGGSDIQSVLPLIATPGVSLLGLSVVVGDGWENAESAHLRRFLEIAGHPEVAVHDGATLPLVNSVARLRLWERAYGPIPWKGAWGGTGSMAGVPDTEPPVPALPEGAPRLAASRERAADFLIRAVHEHPHQVTVVAAGPMTNLALAIRMDPSFAATARQLVFMGGLIDTNMQAVVGNADYASDFNMIFDPEAAHIVVTAPWAKIVCVGNVSNGVMMNKALMARIDSRHTAVTDYLARFYQPLPLWDEMASAIAVDPTLVTRSVEAYFDIDSDPGVDYGHAHIWTAALAPKGMGLRAVQMVQAIDTRRFLDGFVRDAQHASPGAPATN